MCLSLRVWYSPCLTNDPEGNLLSEDEACSLRILSFTILIPLELFTLSLSST